MRLYNIAFLPPYPTLGVRPLTLLFNWVWVLLLGLDSGKESFFILLERMFVVPSICYLFPLFSSLTMV